MINLLYRPIIWVIFNKTCIIKVISRFIGDNIGLSNKCDTLACHRSTGKMFCYL